MDYTFDLEATKEFIRNTSESSSIYIGADSVRYRGNDEQWYAEYTVAVVVHKDSSKGCRVFGKVDTQRDYDNKHDRPSTRLMNEVYRAAQMYLDLIDAIGDRHCEVHLDINPDDMHGSSCVIQQATGYIRGMCGFPPKVKPDAFSASYAADRLKHILGASQ
jgi:predicted RNase H-related nuclease YkuK (DUF458 family)